MSIRTKLILVFILVVGFSGANLSVYFWSKAQSDQSLEELGKATEVQGQLAQIQRELNDLRKQNAIMGQFISGTEDVALRPEEIERFDTQTESVATRIQMITNQVGAANVDELAAFVGKYDYLAKSWRRFYLYFGRDHGEALTEMALNAEPLGIEVTQVYLPELIKQEQARMDEARENYYNISTVMFGGSTLILLLFLLLFSKDLVKRLAGLKSGALKIGSGDLDHQILDSSHDELGSLAQGFNDMSRRLSETRDELDKQYKIIDEQRERTQHLLLNILPESTAEELQQNGVVAPQYYSAATVMFADIKGFSLAAEQLSVDMLVEILDDYFTAFDKICDKYNIEKLKTVGDCYMAVSGVPNRGLSHCADMILAARECIDVANELSTKEGYPDWKMRIGIDSGPVIAGVVGIKKFAFDIWGNTVNHAARLESASEAGKINISESARDYVKDLFELTPRGSIPTKESKGIEMYFVEGLHHSILENSQLSPKDAFIERYHVYFRENLEHVPASLLGDSANQI